MSPRICISRNGSSLQKSLHLHIRRILYTVTLRELRTYYKVHILVMDLVIQNPAKNRLN